MGRHCQSSEMPPVPRKDLNASGEIFFIEFDSFLPFYESSPMSPAAENAKEDIWPL